MVGQLFRLAIADLRRDLALSVCQVFTFAAVLTPLLVLFGMQQGVLGQLLEELRRNPVMREIGPRVTGSNRFTEAWLASVRARPDVAFVVADVRFNAATVEVTSSGEPERSPIYATLVPTAPDDPLRQTDAWADDDGDVAVSADVARLLGLKAGSAISMLVPRVRKGRSENQSLALTVALVLPDTLMSGRHAILAGAHLVINVQHYRDGFAVPELQWPGDGTAPEPQRYERFRLYARSIDDVEPLTDWLRSEGVQPVSHIEDIAPIRMLNRNLSIVLGIISAFAAGGLAVAIASTQWNSVRRKRRELALLAVVGYGKRWLFAIPLLQGVILSALGVGLATALFEAASGTIDFVFMRWHKLQSPACTLDLIWFAATGVAALVLTLAASAAASAQIVRIQPAAIIRDE